MVIVLDALTKTVILRLILGPFQQSVKVSVGNLKVYSVGVLLSHLQVCNGTMYCFVNTASYLLTKGKKS